MTEIADEKLTPKCSRCHNELPMGELETKPVILCPYCGLLGNNPLLTIDKETSEKLPKIPDIKVVWIRGQKWFSFTFPNIYLFLGDRGSGKSNNIEVIAIRHPKIIDLFEANDGEALCWCRPEFTRVWQAIHGEKPRILLLHGQTKRVVCDWDTMVITDLKLSTFEEYDVVTLCHKFFADEGDYFQALFTVIHKIWDEKDCWTGSEPWFIVVREAANWLYARLKMTRDDKFAKAEFLKNLRESRHKGLAVGLDTIRWTNLDKEARDYANFTYIKKPCAAGLPDELNWLERYFRGLAYMKDDEAIVVTGPRHYEIVGFQICDFAPWHKKVRENLFKILKIQVEDINTGEMNTPRSYSIENLEHSKIVEKYLEIKSMMVVSKEMVRSPRSIQLQLNLHNDAVTQMGECHSCRNAKSRFSKDIIKIPTRKRPK